MGELGGDSATTFSSELGKLSHRGSRPGGECSVCGFEFDDPTKMFRADQKMGALAWCLERDLGSSSRGEHVQAITLSQPQ